MPRATYPEHHPPLHMADESEVHSWPHHHHEKKRHVHHDLHDEDLMGSPDRMDSPENKLDNEVPYAAGRGKEFHEYEEKPIIDQQEDFHHENPHPKPREHDGYEQPHYSQNDAFDEPALGRPSSRGASGSAAVHRARSSNAFDRSSHSHGSHFVGRSSVNGERSHHGFGNSRAVAHDDYGHYYGRRSHEDDHYGDSERSFINNELYGDHDLSVFEDNHDPIQRTHSRGAHNVGLKESVGTSGRGVGTKRSTRAPGPQHTEGSWADWHHWWPFAGKEVQSTAKVSAFADEGVLKWADEPGVYYDPNRPHPEEHWRIPGYHPYSERPGSFITGPAALSNGELIDSDGSPKSSKHSHYGRSHPIEVVHHPREGLLTGSRSETYHQSLPNAQILSSQERDGIMSYGMLILLLLVLSSLVGGHLTSKYIHKGLNVPVIAIILGCATAFFIWLGGANEEILLSRITSFNESVFFVFILPPIIFASGFELTGKKGRMFFTRFGTILWFALFATLIAFVLNTSGFYLAGFIERFSVKFSLPQAMALGALLSPTDPVTVLSLFREIAVDPVIETVVLGESLLNDAVAILLYRTVVRNDTGVTAASDFLWFGYMFALSMAVGLGVGLCISLLIKVASYRWRVTHEERVTAIETAIILVSPWFSYLTAETLDLSGVVAVLFCGIAMARYAIPNFSESGATVAKNVYASFSQLAETLAFVLLGLSAFAFRTLWIPAVNEGHSAADGKDTLSPYGTMLTLYAFTVVFVSVGRLISIAFTAGIVNVLLRTAEGGRLPQKIQWIVSLSGLRGAVAVALALKARADFGGPIGSVIVSTTLVYVLFTILVVGPCLPRAFKALGIDDIDPHSPIRHKIRSLESHDRSARHIMVWQYMVHSLRRLDGWIYAFVTARGEDGGFIGDSMLLWRPSSDDEEYDTADCASTPTTIVISDP